MEISCHSRTGIQAWLEYPQQQYFRKKSRSTVPVCRFPSCAFGARNWNRAEQHTSDLSLKFPVTVPSRKTPLTSTLLSRDQVDIVCLFPVFGIGQKSRLLVWIVLVVPREPKSDLSNLDDVASVSVNRSLIIYVYLKETHFNKQCSHIDLPG